MKKVVGIIAALLLVGYPAATWWAGRQVEARLTEQYKQVEQVPFLKIVKRDFQRGFSSSTETVTFELLGDSFRGLGKMDRDAATPGAKAKAGPGPAPKPLQLTVRSKINHGPFADGKFAVAVAETELVLDDSIKQEVAKAFGDRTPLYVRTAFGFGGGGSAVIESPAFTHTFEGERGGTLIWGGVRADIDFTSGMNSYILQGAAPKLEFTDNKGGHMAMSDMQFSGEQQRILEDEPMLYSGTQSVKVAQIEFSGRPTTRHTAKVEKETTAASMAAAKLVLAKNVTYDIDTSVAGEFMDVGAKFGAASVLDDKQEYGPVHYDFSVKHLHVRTTAKLYRAIMTMYSDPAAMTHNRDQRKKVSPLAEPAMELINQNPELVIERISFTSPQGEARVSGYAKLRDAKAGDFSNPRMMLAKLDAGANLALPAAMLADMGGANVRSEKGTTGCGFLGRSVWTSGA